jgi:N-acetylneuraminate synthase/sialic acid synthase
MKTIQFGKSKISQDGPCYVIAEIGHNHQGDIDNALKMVKVAKESGVQAVKLQKRNNKKLFTKEYYNKPYDNENSYGDTYGKHRDYLEFGIDQYKLIKEYSEKLGVEFMSTAFDHDSVEFLEKIGINCYKVASGDITNLPLLDHIARTGKPMLISTGAATLEEIHIAYDKIFGLNNQICLFHCVAEYPADYTSLNLNMIKTLRKNFPDAVIGYSGHDNGILAAVIAYLLGATVVEKHFTLNRSWKGTDHKFSLEPEGLRKQVRDLRRVDISLGSGIKKVSDSELEARKKMGKGIYAAHALSTGTIITMNDVCFKTPSNGTPPYMIDEIVGKRLKRHLEEESPISLEILE